VVLQAALNGSRPEDAHPALPVQARHLARDARATPAMVLLAALRLHLAAAGATGEVVVAVGTDGRRRVETEGMVGPLAEALPVRARVADDPTFRVLLARVREGVLDALSGAEDAGPAGGPPADAAFTFRGRSRSAAEALGRRLLRAAADGGTTEHGLSLEVAEAEDGGLSCGWEHAVDAFGAEAAREIADGFRALLERVAAAPDARLSELAPVGAWTPPRADGRTVDELLAELEDAPDDDLLPA